MNKKRWDVAGSLAMFALFAGLLAITQLPLQAIRRHEWFDASYFFFFGLMLLAVGWKLK